MPPVPCPHCGHAFDLAPERRRKCPACGNVVVPRKDLTGNRLLLSLDDLAAFDAEKDVYYARKRLMERAIGLGASEAGWDRAEAELTAKWGFTAAAGDVFWAVTGHELAEAMRAPDWRRVSGIHWTRALFLSETGKPWQRERRESALAMVRHYQAAGVQRLRLLSTGCCEACQAINGRVVTIASELRGPSIPAAGCDADWCSCDYLVEGPVH